MWVRGCPASTGRFSAWARSYLAYGALPGRCDPAETVVVGLCGAAGLGSLLLEGPQFVLPSMS